MATHTINKFTYMGNTYKLDADSRVQGNGRVFYGTCSTPASTSAKVVICADYNGYTIGDILIINFTYEPTGSEPTINVNSKGAKSVQKNWNGQKSTISGGDIQAGINEFIYDGTYLVLLTTNDDTYSGGGTVTSVGVSNATNGGLTVSGSPVTTSGTITVGHSNVLSSAQTTSAVYPIKIDKNGHISEYGSAVTISDTKNTAGSTNSTSKLYLIGATSQAANPQTYSNEYLYFNNGLYSRGSTSSTHTEIFQNYDMIGLYAVSSSASSTLSVHDLGYITLNSTETRLTLDSTSDATLLSNITSLGWTSDVIV